MEIKYLTTRDELLSIRPLILQHHTSMADDDFALFIEEMQGTGYQCIAAFEGAKLVATVGFWIGVRFYCGKYMYINNFVVDKAQRGKGTGSQVMQWLEAEAKRLNCKAVVLDSYVTNSAAHKFYFGKGYVISNFHFKKDI
ncbi:MAG: acetyltransferase, family [Rickettsiales bacterium]|jgi:GNAT superfamily N-acetyltransferase|nr:acetyltransferase, family [Rickettsiales bacterium]